MKLLLKLFIPLFIIILSSISCAENNPVEPNVSANTPPPVIKLSPDTAELLVKEMRELQAGMNKIVPALVAGKWQEIVSIGNQMKDSYIMKKSLTREQMHELHMSLPEDFQKLDHSFHESAGLLAQAASKKNHEQASYYYFKMTEACVNCHTLYATHKFPEFIKPKKQQ
jgi:hypothetical protein